MLSDRYLEILHILSQESKPRVDLLAAELLEMEADLQPLLADLQAKQARRRENAYEVLKAISQAEPGMLFFAQEELLQLVHSENAFQRVIGMELLVNLVLYLPAADQAVIVSDCLELIHDTKLMVARRAVTCLGRIVQVCPGFEGQVTEACLKMDIHTHTRPLIAADIIEVFRICFSASVDHAAILDFVKAQQHSSSPKARQAATQFLNLLA